MEGRVPRIDPVAIRHRCARPLDDVLREDRANCTVFRYPTNCRGIGEMWRRFANKFPPAIFHLGENVTAIDVDQKEVGSNKLTTPQASSVKLQITTEGAKDGVQKTFAYDVLISTMPITELGNLTGLAPNLNLKHSRVTMLQH